jgi:DNA-binding NarL/FixJ family response regulator
MTTLNILIVEDHNQLARALGRAFKTLERPTEVTIAGTKERGQDALVQAFNNEAPFDLAVIDKYLPDGNGCDLISVARRVSPGSDIFILSASLDADEQLRIFEAGAVPLIKPLKTPCDLIRLAERRRHAFIQDLVESFGATYGLSPCQTRVVRATAMNPRSATETARELNISAATLATHWRHIFHKTGVRNQTAVVALLLRHRHRCNNVINRDDDERSELPR